MTHFVLIPCLLVVGFVGCGGGDMEEETSMAEPAADPMPVGPPTYELDQSFPPEMPNEWVMGVPTSVSVDSRDHVWILSRPGTVAEEQRSNAAPPVMEFDAEGAFVQGWGGPADGYDWPDTEHGIFVDHQFKVWAVSYTHLTLPTKD